MDRRLEARLAGRQWYRAAKPCEYGHLSVRRTTDCACKECLDWLESKRRKNRDNAARKKKRAAQKHADTLRIQRKQERYAGRLRAALDPAQVEMMKAAPDVVIDRGAALAAGWGVYRTGRPCARGHAAWRFVSGGACTVCGSFD